MILITGGAGFIGSALACGLNRQGQTDLLLCDALGCQDKWKNLRGVRFKRFVHSDDLFDYLEHVPHARDIRAVVHLGACSDTTETDMDFLYANNVEYSIELCTWSLEHDVRFVYASSAAVYGNGSLGFSDDDALTPRLRPLNKYGFSKWLFDMWVLEHGLSESVAGLRYFNVFGPNEYHKGDMASVVCRAFPRASREGVVRLFESHRPDVQNGEQARDFIYVDEAVDITMFALTNRSANGIFNVGTGRPHTFNELAQGIFRGLSQEPAIEYFPMPEDLRERYQYYTCADMRRLHQAGFAAGEDRFIEQVACYVRDYLVQGYRYLADTGT